jgi:hypothetical protein
METIEQMRSEKKMRKEKWKEVLKGFWRFLTRFHPVRPNRLRAARLLLLQVLRLQA